MWWYYMQVKDFPKIESPFVRKEINNEYVVTSEINPGYEWVLEGKEDEVVCMEKLDGTDVSIVIENKKIVGIYNRLNKIELFGKGTRNIIEGLLESKDRGFLDLQDGQHFGELIGEKINGNPYNLQSNLWIPFMTYGMNSLVYKSWHKYSKSFENLKDWFFKPIDEGGIFSLLMRKRDIKQKPEGIVFHNLKTGQMSKLRLDMFQEFQGKRHKDFNI
ncbi:MAG: hypothetical protein COT14_04010 [Candidatus Diapherotrites archaeon CG08_land_8_20_14_0_20_30_16]|nr:MAG: hypothetical protein COT14_04010 [Candidatus Diapherotrites archaeon CG08_land_8_20_14_0_20_30_16]